MQYITSCIDNFTTLEELQKNLETSERDQQILRCIYSKNPFITAIENRLTKAVLFFLEKDIQYEQSINSIIDCAVLAEDILLIDFLLNKAKNGEEKKHILETSFMNGIIYGNFDVVKKTIEMGVDLHKKDEMCIVIVAKEGYEDILEYLLKNHKFSEEILERALNNARIWNRKECANILQNYVKEDCVIL